MILCQSFAKPLMGTQEDKTPSTCSSVRVAEVLQPGRHWMQRKKHDIKCVRGSWTKIRRTLDHFGPDKRLSLEQWGFGSFSFQFLFSFPFFFPFGRKEGKGILFDFSQMRRVPFHWAELVHRASCAVGCSCRGAKGDVVLFKKCLHKTCAQRNDKSFDQDFEEMSHFAKDFQEFLSQECLATVSLQDCHSSSVTPRASLKSVLQDSRSQSVTERVPPQEEVAARFPQECPRGSPQECAAKAFAPTIGPGTGWKPIPFLTLFFQV